jgi:hypothetical protein
VRFLHLLVEIDQSLGGFVLDFARHVNHLLAEEYEVRIIPEHFKDGGCFRVIRLHRVDEGSLDCSGFDTDFLADEAVKKFRKEFAKAEEAIMFVVREIDP